jgi:hypothetical protein
MVLEVPPQRRIEHRAGMCKGFDEKKYDLFPQLWRK